MGFLWVKRRIRAPAAADGGADGVGGLIVGEVFGLDLDAVREAVVFCGDSPNDAPMFAYFPNSVGVANVRAFAGRLDAKPAWVTERPGGHGFAELAELLLAARPG